jgi:phosphatidate cytidylyltransferase
MRFPGSRRVPNFLAEVAAAVFGVLYLSLLPATIILLRHMGFTIALLPLVLTWLYDTFAYVTGSAFGRHRIAPTVSPKKSWEGTLLALPLTFFCTWGLNKLWLPAATLVDALIITLGIGILGTLGDLLESGMKREVGLKDASKVFPGHGGFLDRMDSLIFNIPFFYLYLLLRL